MLKRVYLTAEQQKIYDPTGKGYQHMRNFKAPQCFENLPPYIEQFDIRDWFTKSVVANKFGNKHRLYTQYSTEMLDKCGRQGGHFPFDELESLVESYYEEADKPVHIDAYLRLGRDYLIQVIRERLQRVGQPSYVIPKYYNTSSGLRTMCRKGSYTAETHSPHVWIHPFPNLPGERVMRSKNRVIFMDDVSNVRAIEETLSMVREWLKANIPEYFGAWLNPMIGVNPDLTSYVDKQAYFVESDYKSMDIHFSRTVVEELILPIYEQLLPDTFLSFATFVSELFEQELYMGDYVLQGLHNLLSGQGITNDFETIYTVELYLGRCAYYGILNNVIIKAIGDDATVGILKCTKRFPYYLLDSVIDSSGQANMIIHSAESGKSAIRKGETIFCRKVYYASGKRDECNILMGAYPSPLVVNNVIQPEHLSPNRSQAAIAILQRCDNAVGSPDYSQLVQRVVRCCQLDLTSFKDEDIETVTSKDWWFRVYGERWNPESSPTFIKIKNHKY